MSDLDGLQIEIKEQATPGDLIVFELDDDNAVQPGKTRVDIANANSSEEAAFILMGAINGAGIIEVTATQIGNRISLNGAEYVRVVEPAPSLIRILGSEGTAKFIEVQSANRIADGAEIRVVRKAGNVTHEDVTFTLGRDSSYDIEISDGDTETHVAHAIADYLDSHPSLDVSTVRQLPDGEILAIVANQNLVDSNGTSVVAH